MVYCCSLRVATELHAVPFCKFPAVVLCRSVPVREENVPAHAARVASIHALCMKNLDLRNGQPKLSSNMIKFGRQSGQYLCRPELSVRPSNVISIIRYTVNV